MQIPNYKIISKINKEGSKMEIQAEIPHEELKPFRKRALDALRDSLDIPGFRQGKATDEVIEKHVGAFTILEKTAGEALAEIYPRILADEGIDAVGHPHISITKLAPENVLAFTAELSVMPEITLTDYKKSAKKAMEDLKSPELAATDEEIEQSLLTMRKRLAHMKWHEEHPEDTEHGHGEIPDSELPELTDELVQSIGPYKSSADLREEAKKAIEEDKRQKEYSKRRAAIADRVVQDTPFPIPDVFVDGELSMMLGEFRQTLAHMGTTLDDYLKNIGKSIEDLKNDWKGDAEKRARLQLILNRIADAEKLHPEEEKIHAEVKHLIEHHPGAREENVRAYVESIMRNDLVFNFLEGKKEEEEEEKK